MDDRKLRAWWSQRQALDGRLMGATAAEVLAQTGWARSVGGAAPYLTLFARAGLSREAVDAALAAREIHELPSARGCTYVLPAEDFALGLKVGAPFSGGERKVAAKLGVTEKEIDRLCQAVADALAKGPLDPEGLREGCGKAVRSLGEAGKKKGLTTTLPVALGKLQAEGVIRRVPTNGRLDQQRYQYALWKPNPLAKFKLSLEAAQAELARRFFRWTGPASLAELQQFSGLGVKASKAAVEALRLVPLEPGSELLLFPDDLEQLASFAPPKKPQYVLVSSLDGLAHLRRDLGALLPEKERAAGAALSELDSHAIFDRGQLVGLWDFDPEANELVWRAFGKPDAALKEAVARTERFVQAQLGDARTFSLDSPKSRKPRLEALRAAG